MRRALVRGVHLSSSCSVWAAPAPVEEYVSPARALSYAPLVHVVRAAPTPVVKHGSPVPAVNYAAPAPMQYAPTVQHAAPVRHPAPTMTVGYAAPSQCWLQPRIGIAPQGTAVWRRPRRRHSRLHVSSIRRLGYTSHSSPVSGNMRRLM